MVIGDLSTNCATALHEIHHYLVQHEALAFDLEHDELHTGPDERLPALEVVDEPLRRRFQREPRKCSGTGQSSGFRWPLSGSTFPRLKCQQPMT